VTLEPGARVAIKIAGFEPGTEMEMWMFSTPIRIGTATVGPSGTLDTVLVIPKDVPAGAHRVVITTNEKGKGAVTFALGVSVRKFTKESNIATWLIVVPILSAVGAALFLPRAASSPASLACRGCFYEDGAKFQTLHLRRFWVELQEIMASWHAHLERSVRQRFYKDHFGHGILSTSYKVKSAQIGESVEIEPLQEIHHFVHFLISSYWQYRWSLCQIRTWR
jgi:hypothetical protein